MVSQTQTDRVVEGVELPPVGTWRFDPAHTTIGFVARHLLSKVRGRFNEFDGTIVIADRPEDSKAVVEIATSSVETKTDMRDDHLRSPDFFDSERYPTMTFRSTELRPTGGNRFQLVGDLTIKDVTNPVTLDAELHGFGPGLDPNGPLVAFFSARAEVDREDWDLTWNVAVETGGVLVGRMVQIEIETELLLQPS
ncbi:MAG TPA: YceI family protein [Actinomycetota bacterium]|nr:YceI family protein [Actinomycetota bacterium]